MKYMANIVYGSIIGRFLLQIADRMLHPDRASVVGGKYLLMQVFNRTSGEKSALGEKSAHYAMVFGYADDAVTLDYHCAALFTEGFKPIQPEGRMIIASRSGLYTYRDTFGNEYGPITFLTTTSRGCWWYVAEKFGMQKKILDQICYEGTAPDERPK
jgi:hypothetical protein